MASIIKAHFLVFAMTLVACSSSHTNDLFGTGGVGGAAGAPATGGSVHELDAGSDAGGAAGATGVDSGGVAGAPSDAAGDDAMTECNQITCDENTSCGITCTLDSVVMYCRSFEGEPYSWQPAAVCGTTGYPYGTTFLCADGAGVCCVNTNNWEKSC
jgi:hypothetical protein